MKDKKYIYSDRVWIDNSFQQATLILHGDRIEDIIYHHHQNAIDYSGKVIMPGVIDMHVHINEPGRTSWEGFETATTAAAFGGTTTVVDMPLNSSPVVTSIDALQKKQSACKNKLHINCGFWAGAIDDNIDNVNDLLDAGCLGVKVFLSHSGIDEFPNISTEHLEKLMAGIADRNVPILAHCEFDTLPSDIRIQDNPSNYKLYAASRPNSWEEEAIKTFVTLCGKYNCKSHIVHLATETIILWVIGKRKNDIPLTIETCPHYIYFNGDQIEDGNTLLKCAPPIRNKKTKEGLIQGIKDGHIDFLSSDHSPAPAELKEIKTGDFTKAWGGIAGLQFLLSASWTALSDDISLDSFIPLLTSKPASFLSMGNTIGHIQIGHQADLCIWKPEESFIVRKEDIKHRHKETPYLGETLNGIVYATYVNGQCVFGNNVLQNRNCGKMIMNK